MFTKFQILIMTLICFSLLSCNKKTDETKITTDMDGTWANTCTADGSNSELDSITVNNGVLNYVHTEYFGNTTCTTSNYLTMTVSMNISVTGDSASITGAKEYQGTITSFSAIPATADVVTVLGTACGGGWSVGTAKSVFGCAEFSVDNLASGNTHYDVFKVTTTATPNTLQFGTKCSSASKTGGFCTTTATRPTTIDSANGATFSKQ